MDNVYVAFIIVLLLVIWYMVRQKTEAMSKIRRTVGVVNRANETQVAPGVVNSVPIMDMSHTWSDGRQTWSCDECPNIESCHHCPQWNLSAWAPADINNQSTWTDVRTNTLVVSDAPAANNDNTSPVDANSTRIEGMSNAGMSNTGAAHAESTYDALNTQYATQDGTIRNNTPTGAVNSWNHVSSEEAAKQAKREATKSVVSGRSANALRAGLCTEEEMRPPADEFNSTLSTPNALGPAYDLSADYLSSRERHGTCFNPTDHRQLSRSLLGDTFETRNSDSCPEPKYNQHLLSNHADDIFDGERSTGSRHARPFSTSSLRLLYRDVMGLTNPPPYEKSCELVGEQGYLYKTTCEP